MKFLLLIPVVIGAYILWTLFKARKKNDTRDYGYLNAIIPILNEIKDGKKPNQKEIKAICEDYAQRFFNIRLLNSYERLDLIPTEYQNQLSGAISSLSYLLTNSDNLGASPDQIELQDTIPFPSPDATKDVIYYVFRFKMNPPHWAAATGWRAGVAGPYYPDTPYYVMAFGTFSRFDPINDLTSEGHARWVHENKVIKKGFFEL
jgi:hypothetical protein